MYHSYPLPTRLKIASASEESARLNAAIARLLASLPFPAFAEHVRTVLSRLGYQEGQMAGRLTSRGKNRNGGIDLTAVLPGGVSPRRAVVAQIKQYAPERAVHQRFVNELRGAALRSVATEALLVTTGTFSSLAEDNAKAGQRVGIAPVRLIDGTLLASESERLSIGVVRHPESGKPVIDEPTSSGC